MQKKKIQALPVKLRSPLPCLNGQGGPFSGCQKHHFLRVFQDQVQIDFDNEQDDFCDENRNNFNDHGDGNDQKQTNTMAFHCSLKGPY